LTPEEAGTICMIDVPETWSRFLWRRFWTVCHGPNCTMVLTT